MGRLWTANSDQYAPTSDEKHYDAIYAYPVGITYPYLARSFASLWSTLSCKLFSYLTN